MVLVERAVRPARRAAEPSTRQADMAIRGAAKSYSPGRPVFSDVSFDVAPGEAVALLGANGAGKSTLLRCCVRLIEPDAGAFEILGQQVTGLTPSALRRLRSRIGFVFQKHNLVPRLCGLTNVIHGCLGSRRDPRCWLHATAPETERVRAMECLDQVGLADYAMARADTLSGGQSQRVAIARALMQKPDLILADEPVASLDPSAGEEVMELFISLIQQHGLTVLFTSHNLRQTLAYADRVVALRQGQVIIDEPACDLTIRDLRGIYD